MLKYRTKILNAVCKSALPTISFALSTMCVLRLTYHKNYDNIIY